jgi:diguanylate cyclase (GGDEF)-like protein
VLSLFPNKRKDLIIDFQAKLLNELSLASGTLQSRQNPACNIATLARKVLDVHFLYTFVQSGTDDRYELQIFWCNMPAEQNREKAVALVRQAVLTDQRFAPCGEYAVVHTTPDPTGLLPEIPLAAMDLRSRTFSLQTPKTCGMVGLGLAANSTVTAEDRLAIESLLVALTNIASSVKALSTYTREIERFATRDPLTNLYNQIAFWDLLNYETERSKRQAYRFSLLVIDFDNFKAVNDLYGHDVGDTLLKEFAGVLKSAVRAGDIAARYAGDQFIAILPVCDEGQAYIVARRILENVREFSLKLPNSAVVRLSVSIGLAVFPDHAKDSKDLYLLADSMLLQAKTFGKDRLSMPSEHDDVEVLKSMGDKNLMILEALSKRRIVPYFQPIMNMQDMKIEAYEVLTRIVMNDRVIPACEFIETAESMGAIGKIDYQLIEHAFSKVRDTKYNGDLFLNLSPRALVLNEFMPTVRKLLTSYNIEPTKMVFEITERDTVKGLDTIERHIQDLRAEGFRFAIDDFGAGYSSFQYLRKFSVDFLKVDGDFIKNMNGTRTVEKAIVRSIAELSQKLGIKTIAEFVETEDILNHVGSAGIDYAQGYYIKRPSPDLA